MDFQAAGVPSDHASRKDSDSVQVVCAHCNTTNRLPRARLGEGAKCGSCKQALLTGQIGGEIHSALCLIH